MAHDAPERTIAALVIFGIAIVAIVQFFRWLFSGPKTADPWDQTISEAVDAPESLPVCHRCVTEHSELAHFCPQCGAAVGEFNNVLPFEQLFSEGEVFRNGTMLKTPPTLLLVIGYFLISIIGYSVLTPLFLLVPVYWFFLIRNFRRRTESALPNDGELPPPLPE